MSCDRDVSTYFSSSFSPWNVEGGMLHTIVDVRGAERDDIAANMLHWVEEILTGDEELTQPEY